MRKKTPNAECRVEGAQWIRDGSVREDAPDYAAPEQTFNFQRPTLNAQRESKPRFDLENRLLEFHLAGQLLRCGTSPYGNHGEVEAAKSRKDFVHKLKVCLKELKETRR